MSNEDLDFVKAKTKEAALSSYRSYNNVPQNLSNEEFIALKNLSKNKDLINQKSLKDWQLSFAINQEKHVDKIIKKLVESNSMTDKTKKFLKYVGTRPGVMYGSCKVHKASVENFPPFRPILSDLNTRTYQLAKFLVPILKPWTTNEFTVKDSFHFAEEIVDQQHDLFMGSLNVDSLFTNIPLDKEVLCKKE